MDEQIIPTNTDKTGDDSSDVREKSDVSEKTISTENLEITFLLDKNNVITKVLEVREIKKPKKNIPYSTDELYPEDEEDNR